MEKALTGILEEIIAQKRHEVEARKAQVPLEELQEAARAMPPTRDFAAALRREAGPVKLLAEIKAASPSQGVIRAEFDAAVLAREYERQGAAAVSVLTDFKYFGGTDAHLKAAKAATGVPILRKDFTIDSYQLYESKVIGADAILLMAQVLEEETYANLFREAQALGLHVLAEGHTEEEIRFLVDLGVPVIGVNNRDFRTMQVDLATTLHRRPLIPSDRVLVSQSGYSQRTEVLRAEAAGVDAIQVGTSIMQHGEVGDGVRGLMG